MDMADLVRAHEECVVVDVVVFAIDMGKYGNVFLCAIGFVDIEEIGGHQVEVLQIEVELARKVLDAKTVVAQLGDHHCQPLLAMLGVIDEPYARQLDLA